MNFNIYLDDDTGEQLAAAAKAKGESRNSLIRQAVRDWLDRQGTAQWPEAVLSHDGEAGMPRFEADREQLRPPADDPLE